MFAIASLHSSLLTSSSPFQNSGKFDPRTTRTMQDNTEIFDRHKNWNIILFKEALKTGKLNSIPKSGLKVLINIQLITSLAVNFEQEL